MDSGTIFRRRLHRMLEPRPRKWHIADGAEAWGLVVTRSAIAGVQLWYSANAGVLTLGLTTPRMQAAIPPDAVPPGAEAEVSRTGRRMFRWQAPELSLAEPPEEQAGAEELVAQIRAAFDWFNATRIDKRP